MGPAVIDPRAVGWVLGQFFAALAVAMLVPLGYAGVIGSGDTAALWPAVLWTSFAAAVLLLLSRARPARDLRQREGILLVVLVWVGACLFAALPFYFSPYFASFTDAFFESVSGFTTTGATVLPDVEVLSRGIQFWRCFSHWLGGMGIVLLGVAILPLIGQGGMHLYRAEFSGARSERLTPRIVESAKALWKIYLALTIAGFVALRLAGMDSFEALCHAFSALGTGGFSTRTASIAAYESPLIEYIIIVLMLLGGASFILHYRLWIERRAVHVFTDYEFLSYLAVIAAASAIIAAVLVWHDGFSLEPGYRAALFQVVSIVTTTGFITQDYATWYPFCQLLLLALMFIGGCTGSTAGGLKVARVGLLAQVVDREFRRMAEPQGVFTIRLGGQAIPEITIQSLLNLVYLAWLVNFIACLLLAAAGVDVLTAISAVAACMFNVGPGLGAVGPIENYGALPALAKWVLAGCMIAGRLEFYTLLVVLTSSFWRR
nr:TrkH family potassium uptake protein [Gammaproteobacteria bacterium]